MTETRKMANVNEVYLRQPVIRKWNLKHKKCRIIHKDFTNWRFGADQNINSLKYAFERQLAGSESYSWTNLIKAIHVMGKRGESRNWQAQDAFTSLLWGLVGLVLRKETEDDFSYDKLLRSLRYDYFKEEYTYGQSKSAGEV